MSLQLHSASAREEHSLLGLTRAVVAANTDVAIAAAPGTSELNREFQSVELFVRLVGQMFSSRGIVRLINGQREPST